jgi:hypothetical protein
VQLRHTLASPRDPTAQARREVAWDRFVDPRELVLLALVLATYGGVWAIDTAIQDLEVINIAGPSVLITILLGGAWWQLRRDPYSIWQPLFWFRVACAAYYGVGALVPYIGNDVTISAIQEFYGFDDADAFKVGLINVLCILTVLATAAVLSRRRRISTQPRHNSQRWTLMFAAILLAGGGAVRYLVVLPWLLNLSDTVPGLVVPLARCYIIGLFLLVLAGLRGNLFALLLSFVLVPLDMAVGLLTFAKTEVLVTLMFVYLAVLHHKLSPPRIAVGLVLVIGIYSQLDPIIHYGREELWRQTKSIVGTLEQRLDILSTYTGTEWEGTARAEQQSALSRLTYVSVAAMVVNFYDAGRPGDSLDDLPTILVPRVLWPDKPVITGVGFDLYTVATGREGLSSISPGLFGEAYWNLGWIGIPVLMIPLGFIYALLSRYSVDIMKRERWVHMPAVLLGVWAGFRVDGWYVVDIVGSGGLALTYAILANGLERFVARRGAEPTQA